MHRKVRINAISLISIFTILFVIVSGYGISGCRNNSSNDAKFTSPTPDITTPNPAPCNSLPSGMTTPDTATPSTTGQTLTWDAPTTYSDGITPLTVEEYRVYFGTSPNPRATGIYHPVSAPTTVVKVKDVISQGTGTYYFVVTAMDSFGNQSDPSNEVCKYLY